MYQFPEMFEATFKYQQNKFLFRDSNISRHTVNSKSSFYNSRDDNNNIAGILKS